MNILLLGSGGREHAIAAKIAQSARCDKLFIVPGNAGTADYGTNCRLFGVDDFESIGSYVIGNNVSMVVVGPEAPLVAGIADYFASDPRLRDVMLIGPSRRGAMLEGSKDFAKDFMTRHKIPTARYRTFTADTLAEGQAFLETLDAPYVLKADGLAAGKGVLIEPDLETAKRSLAEMLGGKFGDASASVVIEEYLSGIELSVFVLTDGQHYMILPTAKDYKRIGEGDTGLNTGGMGSVSPVPFADKEFMKKVEDRIVKPTVRGLRDEKINYRGFIFIGLMNVGGDPYVIEYNVRMGDPETESVFPRIKSDVVELFENTAKGTLDRCILRVDPRTAACVMMAAGGYPGSYEKGKKIDLGEDAADVMVFHCGTRRDFEGNLLTNGGRVICTTALAETLPEAILKSYNRAASITWEGKYLRRDIGQDLLKLMLQ